MTQNVTTSTTKGAILGLVLIVISLVIYLMKLEDPALQWIPNCILIIGIILSISQYGKQIDYNSTFGNYFSHGFKIAAMVTIIMIIYLVIFMTIFPEFTEKAIDIAKKHMEEKKNMTQDQIDKAIDITRKFFTLFLVLGTLVWDLILGSIGALIGAAITKKHPATFQEEHINQIGS